jgi:hypothetical protein
MGLTFVSVPPLLTILDFFTNSPNQSLQGMLGIRSAPNSAFIHPIRVFAGTGWVWEKFRMMGLGFSLNATSNMAVETDGRVSHDST